MKTSRKILLVFLIGLFIYTCFGIEFSDLSWKTNGETYKPLLAYIAIFIGMGFDHWYEKESSSINNPDFFRPKAYRLSII